MKFEPVSACIFLSLTFLCLPVPGQNPTPPRGTTSPAVVAAAVAEQQGIDEKFKQMAADLEALRAANQLLAGKVSALTEELQQVRAEEARLAGSAISRDDLKPLAQKIDEVDKKRIEDKDAISEEIKNTTTNLLRQLAPPVDPSLRTSRGTPPPVPPPVPPAATDGFSYTIKEGDFLVAIVTAYNNDFKSKGVKTISVQQVKEVNPGVDWNRLKVGQKIVIPRPAGYPAS
jgi:LysM repeat protein